MANYKMMLPKPLGCPANEFRERRRASKTKLESNKKPGPMKRNDVGKRARIYHPYSSSSYYPWKSNSEEIVKHPSEAQLHLPSNADVVREPFNRQCITPSPTSTPPEVQTQMKPILRRSASPPYFPCRTQSPKRTRTRSRSPSSRSPTSLRRSPLLGSGDQLHVEAVRKRIESLQAVRLYLLRQPGQRAFTVASEDKNENTYRVIIGPQTCTCSSQHSHCIHLLFIMIRVLKVMENDPCIFNKTLKDFEVESLVRKYEQRRKSRLNSDLQDQKFNLPDTITELIEITDEDTEKITNIEYEDQCTICHFPMSEEEGLVMCEKGCKNNFHRHCMEKWSEHCEKESIDCPLCRSVWLDPTEKSHPITSVSSPVQNQMISSSMSETSLRNSSFPTNISRTSSVCSSIRDKPQSNIKNYWIEMFGARLINDLQSGDWSMRENKLKDVIDKAEMHMSQLINDGNTFNLSQSITWIKRVSSFASILQLMAMDPVYRVYTMSLVGLSTLLANYVCFSNEDASTLQELIRPIVRIVLTKCADGLSRTSQASINFITSLSYGQAGDIAVGRETGCPAQEDVTGILFILSCLFESERDDPEPTYSQWQRILGRLYALDELMDVFPQAFHLVHVTNTNCNKENQRPNWSKNNNTQTKLLNYDRITTVLGFALKFLKNPHVNIRKMAERLYIRATRLASHVPIVYKQACYMLEKVDSSLVNRIRDRTPSRDRRREDVEMVLYTSVRFPNRRRSLGRCSLPSSPVCASHTLMSNNFDKCILCCNSPTGRRSSMPTFRRNISTVQNTTFSLTKPQRPTFLPLNGRTSLDSCIYPSYNSTAIPRRCSDGMIQGTDCCFNHICHVHASPCDRKCQLKRQKTSKLTPTVPPNTPMCPVGDLIDLSLPGSHFQNFNCERSTSPCLLDAIPEINSAKNMALNDQNMVSSTTSTSSQKSYETNKRSMLHSLSNVIMKRSSYKEGVDWIVDKVLGCGGFSRCVLGRDAESGTYMAVKQVSFRCCNPDDLEKSRTTVLDEIRIMTKLDHPNVVQLIAACERQEGYDLFMEWMPGGSVADNLNKFGPFSDRIIIRYLWHILSGLEYLHSNRILHRDLKGANLLIDSTGQRLRIADFGAAKTLISHSTLPGEFKREMMGTTAFMAPEVLRGESYGRSCDVWSVGCCVIEMVTTRPPWNLKEITNENALFYRIAASVEPPPIPEWMSDIIKDFALCCLQPIKTNRPSVKKLMTHMCFME